MNGKDRERRNQGKKCSPLHATQQKANEYTGFCSPTLATEHYTEGKWQKIKVLLTVQSSLRII